MSKLKLAKLAYHELVSRYPWHSWYVPGAVEVAYTILKSYRKALRRGLSLGPEG